jgi:hypothetical protein
MFSLSMADILLCIMAVLQKTAYTQVTCSREVFAKLVEGDGHDAVGGVECLLNAVSVMNINVNIQNALMIAIAYELVCVL